MFRVERSRQEVPEGRVVRVAFANSDQINYKSLKVMCFNLLHVVRVFLLLTCGKSFYIISMVRRNPMIEDIALTLKQMSSLCMLFLVVAIL